MIFLVLGIILIGELYDEYLDSCNDSWFGRSYSWIDIYRSYGDLECIK
jgi:hypothetical protein